MWFFLFETPRNINCTLRLDDQLKYECMHIKTHKKYYCKSVIQVYFARYLNFVEDVFEKLSIIFHRVNKSLLLTAMLYITLKL